MSSFSKSGCRRFYRRDKKIKKAKQQRPQIGAAGLGSRC